jgi:hypothetical protein
MKQRPKTQEHGRTKQPKKEDKKILSDFQLPTGIEVKGGRIEAYKSLKNTREMALKWR